MCNLVHMSLDAQVGTIPQWTIADRFRKAREARAMSQTDIADRTGLSRRTVSAIETGDKVPGTKEYNLWQMVTGVPRAWLETGASAPQSPDGNDSIRVTHRYHKPMRVIGVRELVAA